MIPQAPTPTAESIFTDGHTAYRFGPDPVSDADLARIHELVRVLPTAVNSQPLRIAFLRTPPAKARLLPLIAEINRPASASAPVVAILAADTDFHEYLPEFSPEQAGARERYAANPPRRLTMALNNAWLQAGGFILAVRAAGFDAGPMAGIDAAGIDAEFFAGTPLRTILIVNIGHAAPGGTLPRKPRLDFDRAVTLL